MRLVEIEEDLAGLEQFLRLPEFKPALEFIGGRVIQKMSPNRPHGLIQVALGTDLRHLVRPKKKRDGLFGASVQLRGRFLDPRPCFIARGRIPRDRAGVLASVVDFAPDLAIEILSPGQTVKEISAELRFTIKHGLRLGRLIDPVKKRVHVLRPGRRAEILKAGASLSGDDVLPGCELDLDELFSWQIEDWIVTLIGTPPGWSPNEIGAARPTASGATMSSPACRHGP